MAVTAKQKLDVERIRADFPYLEQLQDGKPVAFLDSAASTQKPRQVLDAMTRVLRDVVRERPPRRLQARRAGDRGARGRAREGARAAERVRRARGDLRPQRDRGDQPRRVLLGAERARPGRRRSRHRARAPLELRPVAVRRESDRRELPDASRSTRTASSGWTCSTRSQAARHVKVVAAGLRPRIRSARTTRSSSLRRGRTSAARSSSATRRRRRRTARSTCRRSAATSSRCRATRCAARAAPARSGAAPSCSSRWSPSCSAAT